MIVFRPAAVRHLLVAAGLVSLAACSVPVAPRCPTVKAYSDAESAAITRARDALPHDSPLIDVITDYENLRDDARRCASGG